MDEHNINTMNMSEALLHEYKAGLGKFMQKTPNIAKHFNDFTAACFKEGAVGQKEKQMIALGISLYNQDEYCIVYHTKGCLDQGATEEEIMETVGVASAFGGGTSISRAVTLVQQAIEELSDISNTQNIN